MAYVERTPSGQWRGIYRDPAGRKRSRSFLHKPAALRWAEGQESAVRRGVHRDPGVKAVTVREWAELWVDGRVVENSTAAGDRHRMAGILETWGGETLEGLTTVGLQGWVKRMIRDGRAPATVRKYTGLLSTMLNAAVRERLITENPCRFLQLPKVGAGTDRFLTQDEHRALVAELPAPYDAVAYVAAYTGMRWGEVAGLHVGSIDALRRVIVVRETLTEIEGAGFGMKAYPKSAKPRRVPVAEHVIEELAAHLAAQPATPCGMHAGCSGLVFRNRNGSPLSRHNFRKSLILAAEKAGLDEGLRPHDLRHTAASWLVQAGVSLYEVQNFLGHSSAAVTQRYAHLAPDGGGRLRTALDNKIMGQNMGQKS